MSKDNNPDNLDPIVGKEYTEAERQELERQEKEFLNQTAPFLAGDTLFTASGNASTEEQASSSSLNTLAANISSDGLTDPITEAIRKQILEEQRRLIREHLLKEHQENPQQNPDLGTHLENDEKFREFLKTLNGKDLYNETLEKNSELKKSFENIELTGYRNIHNTYSAENYPGGFRSMGWDGPTQDNVRSQVVKNGAGAEICTLNETTHNTAPIIVNQGGREVTIKSYRTIDFPVTLDEKASGTMHLSLVAKDKDGNAPPIDKAVYFTAHYEATPAPDGIPKLKEVSSPQPLKFLGEGQDAVGFVEHDGEIYTLPVTRDKYQKMMREVELNRGQSIDLSKVIAEDQFRIPQKEQTVTPPTPTTEKPIEVQNTEIPSQEPKPVPEVMPFSSPQKPKISQMQQPQQVESSGIPNQVINAATGLSQALKDLLKKLNKDLKNENEPTGLISEVAEKILQDKNVNPEEKQAGIKALSENILNNKELPESVRAEGINAILETVKNDVNLAESEKVKLLTATAGAILNSGDLEKSNRQKLLESVADVALSLNGEVDRWQAIDGITNSVIDSSIGNDEKGNIFAAIADKVNASKHNSQEKSQLISDILDKGKEAGILNKEQEQLIQQNLDKINAEQEKDNKIAAVQGIVVDPSDIVKKTEAIKNITAEVLDSPAATQVKAEIIEGITGVVANSPLNGKEKSDIAKGMSEIIAGNDMPMHERATIMESAEKGVAGSGVKLEDKEQMTKAVVNGIYDSTVEPDTRSKLTQSIASGIDKSSITDDDKIALKNAANEAALDKETQNLSQGLESQEMEQSQTKKDFYKAVKDTIDAGIDLASQIPDTQNKPKNEEIAAQTSHVLSDPDYIYSKADSIRNTLSASSIRTADERRTESEQQVKGLVENFNKESSTDKRLEFIQSNIIDNKNLSKDVRLSVIDSLLKKQSEKRGAAVDAPKSKTEDVRTLSGKSELRPLSKEEPDIEKSRMVVDKDKVNIKDNTKIMGKLMDAKNAIQSESASVTNSKLLTSNKKGQSFP